MLGEALLRGCDWAAEGWNFGSEDRDARSVQWIVEQMCDWVEGAEWAVEEAEHSHEAILLKLDSSKAKSMLGWAPRWDLVDALKMTYSWHQAWRSGADMASTTIDQIKKYEFGKLGI